MASTTPLKGSELIDCAKANAELGTEVACERCGYGDDLDTFGQQLKQACQDIGVEIESIEDLITDTRQSLFQPPDVVEIGPDTPSQL